MRTAKHDDIVRQHCLGLLDNRVRRLVSMALSDLYFGPFVAEDFEADDPDETIRWPGYVPAIEEIRKAADKLPRVLWIDTEFGEVLESEPEGWDDEDTGEWVDPIWEREIYCEFNTRDIMRATFGALITNGL